MHWKKCETRRTEVVFSCKRDSVNLGVSKPFKMCFISLWNTFSVFQQSSVNITIFIVIIVYILY